MNICVYGASSHAIEESFIKTTKRLGMAMADRGHTLIFGAGASGVMGATARGVKSHNGKVIGISPKFFNVDGILYDKCDELIFTDDMRERKKLLLNNSDAIIVAPGGIGTFDEFFEVLTLKQLGQHNKAIVLFNVNNFFEPLISMMNTVAKGEFMTEKTLSLYKVFDSIDETLDYIENYVPEEHNITYYKALNNDILKTK